MRITLYSPRMLKCLKGTVPTHTHTHHDKSQRQAVMHTGCMSKRLNTSRQCGKVGIELELSKQVQETGVTVGCI